MTKQNLPTDEEIRKMLDRTVWSFSRVNAYATCPKMFFDTYILGLKRENNAFAQYGSFVHLLLEKYYSGQLPSDQLESEYRELYPLFVDKEFPTTKMAEGYYNDGLKFFTGFFDPFCDYKPMGCEVSIRTRIRNRPFVGYIDLLMTRNGSIAIADHKSKKQFKSKAELDEYARQLYLYAYYVYETYGEYPNKLMFNTFRSGVVEEIDFDRSAFDEALSWFESTIEKIYAEKKWKDAIYLKYKSSGKKLSDYKYPDFFCQNICSMRGTCNRAKTK